MEAYKHLKIVNLA